MAGLRKEEWVQLKDLANLADKQVEEKEISEQIARKQ